MGGSASVEQEMHELAGIDPKNVVDEYRARDLAALSDTALYRAGGRRLFRGRRSAG